MLTYEWWRSVDILPRAVVHSYDIKVTFKVFYEACWFKQPSSFEANIYIALCLQLMIVTNFNSIRYQIQFIVSQGKKKKKEWKKIHGLLSKAKYITLLS